jgi:hypothetical protein
MSSRITSAIVMLLSWEVGRDLEKSGNLCLVGFWKISVVPSDAKALVTCRAGLTESSTASLPSLACPAKSSLNESLIESWPQESSGGDSFLLFVDQTLLAGAEKGTHSQG